MLQARAKYPTSTQIAFLPHFRKLKVELRKLSGSHFRYYRILRDYGFATSIDITDREKAVVVYHALQGAVNNLRWQQ